LLRSYGISAVIGDRYGGEWVQQAFRKQGIRYQASKLTKSSIYGELLPLVNSQSVELLDHPKLLRQLACLERRVSRTGRDLIDHMPGAKDDIANSAAGVLVLAATAQRRKLTWGRDTERELARQLSRIRKPHHHKVHRVVRP
jgi:hypothetical protein